MYRLLARCWEIVCARNFWLCVSLLMVATCAVTLREAATRVAAAEHRLALVLHGLPNGVVLGDAAYHVAYSNPAVTELTGWSAADLASQGFLCFIPGELRPRIDIRVKAAIAQLRAAPDDEYAYIRKILPIRCKDGKFIRAMVTIGVIVHARQYEVFAFITPLPATDLTDQVPSGRLKPSPL